MSGVFGVRSVVGVGVLRLVDFKKKSNQLLSHVFDDTLFSVIDINIESASVHHWTFFVCILKG